MDFNVLQNANDLRGDIRVEYPKHLSIEGMIIGWPKPSALQSRCHEPSIGGTIIVTFRLISILAYVCYLVLTALNVTNRNSATLATCQSNLIILGLQCH